MASPLFAQPFGNDYWAPVDTSTQQTLTTTAHSLLRSTHNRIPFTSTNWPILEAADEHPSIPGSVLDVYRNSTIPFPGTGEDRPYDREHVWPQSIGFPQGGTWSANPRADLHNLFISDRSYNNARANHYYDFVDNTTDEWPTDFGNGEGGGPTGFYPGNSNWRDTSGGRWETWVGRRGDVARAYLYMALRYNGGTGPEGSPEPNLILSDNPALFVTGEAAVAYHGLRSVILQWHDQDPPDAKELRRHDIIAEAQQNRNPFIDHPGWAECIYGNDCSGVAPIHPQGLFATPDINGIILTWSPRPESDLAGYNVHRSPAPDGAFSLVNTGLVNTTTFTDTTALPNVTYRYAVTAVDALGNESLLSQPAESTFGTRALIAQETFATTTGWSIDAGTGDFGNAYFGRWSISPSTVPSQLATSITGVVDNFFIGGANTSGTPTQQQDPTFPLPANGIHTLTLDPIDVSGFTSLRVVIGLNARPADVYDSAALSNGDFLRILTALDGEAPVLIGQFTRVGTSTGSNGRLGIDLNLDGLGNVEIQDYSRLEDYEFDVHRAEGDTLIVQVVTRFDANGEEIVYDNIRVTGIPRAAEPSSTDSWALY